MARLRWKDSQLIGDVIQELQKMGQSPSPGESMLNKQSPFATPAPILVNVNSGSSVAVILPGGAASSDMESSQVELPTADDFLTEG